MSDMNQPEFKILEEAYGFDDVAILPGDVTINPDMTQIDFKIGEHTFDIPVMASAMDAVVSPNFATKMHALGGLGVLNLEGIYTRYDDPQMVLQEVLTASSEDSTEVLQRVYSKPVVEDFIEKRIKTIKSSGAICAASVTPQNTKRLAPIAVEAGVDILVVQSTVTTARHVSRRYTGLVFSELVRDINIPIIVGNCVTKNAALELMETGIDGLLVGVGPGAACTTREVVGVGMPQVSATIQCAAARNEYMRRKGRYVSVITDGGVRTGGDLCKAIVSGADAVMLGTPLALSEEAPGRGFNWGMATPHAALPRGTRIHAGLRGTLDQILFGPTAFNDGTQNLIGALKECMGMCGALTIQDMHKSQLIIAPSIKTEGKSFQARER